MLKLSCICGQVNIEIDKKPQYINECNCTLCGKSGARWGYFHPSEVAVGGATHGYSREDKAEPNSQIRFCQKCGATNMWLADESDLAGIELRYPDGRSWSGAGDFGYVRDARIIGE
ncbi:MAG: hypothetical protein JO111_12130 [Caulobacteraceae bacterium]|nr:hypothetical protein [Caulobacteraceae bacterium]